MGHVKAEIAHEGGGVAPDKCRGVKPLDHAES